MKKGLLLFIVLLLPIFATAQENKYFSAGKMVATAGAGFSGLGLGFGAGFEYGITDKLGIFPAYTRHSYESGTQTWGFNAFDIWGTWHDKSIGNMFGNSDKVDAYFMAGVTFVSFAVENSVANSKEETSSNIGFGGGAGGRYHFSDKLSMYGEGRYRFATFETDSYKLALAWYSINFGISYAIN